MAKKLTLDTIKERLKKINPNIEILSEEYINNSTKLKCKCLIDGYEWSPTWNNLAQGYGCPECSGNRKDYTIEYIRKKLFEINPNIEILSDKYINNHVKLKCKCLIDNYEWGVTWGNLRKGQGCPECKRKKAGNSQRLTIHDVKKRLKEINPNIEILTEKYVNNHTKLRCKCLIDGYEWGISWNELFQGNGCPKCSGTIKLTLEIVKERVFQINPNIQVVDKTYKGAHSKLKCRCLLDGYNWDSTWNSISKGRGCPKCNSSKGEKNIFGILSNKNIAYKEQYRLKDCKYKNPLSFDFALFDNNNNLLSLIEYDGEQHFRPVDFASRGEEWAMKQHKNIIKRDEIKNTYCKENNIPLLRIPYWEKDNIESILDEWLEKIGLIKKAS